MKKKYLLLMALALISAIVVAGVQAFPSPSVQEVQGTNEVTAVNDSVTDITIYVSAGEAPYLYAWAYDENDGYYYDLNGGWPGTLYKEQVSINGTRFWKQTISSTYQSINIIFTDGNYYQTGDIDGISSDSYFIYDGYGGYTDVTEQYAGSIEEDLSSIEQETITFPTSGTRYYYDTDTIAGIKAKVVLSSNTGSSNPYDSYGTLRFYANNSLKIIGGENIINDVVFNMSGSYTMNVTADAGTMEDNHWTGLANEITFVNTSGSQTRFTSITITYLVSEEVLFERLTSLVATADSTIATLQYANVPGRAELVQLVDSARAVSLDDESVDKAYLLNFTASLRSSLAAVVALDSDYQQIAANLDSLTALIANNQFVNTKLAAEEEAFNAEILNGLSEGAYQSTDTPAVWTAIYDYATRLSYTHLDISVPVQGAMGDSILAKVENFSDVQSLRLSGKLNSDDIYSLKNRLTSLRELYMDDLDWTAIPAEQFSGKTGLLRVTLPGNVQTIGNSAFYNCQNLKPITFPATLKSIGEYAFYRTYNIGDVVLPEGLSSIGTYAFYQSRLTSVSFPSTLKTISSNSFDDCDYLITINFNGQTTINSYAFTYCDGLTSVKFPETLTSIGYEAFYYCSKLKDIAFNEGLTSIGDYAFYNCDALQSVVIPSTVLTFNGYYAFRGCDNLTQMTCNAIVPPYTNSYNITGKSGLDLYVPQLSVNVYKQTAGWSDFNIHGTNVMPDNIVIQSDYKLNWPDSLSMDYKPNVDIWYSTNSSYYYDYTYGSLSVNGNSTLSARQFSMIYDPDIDMQRGSYYDSNSSRYRYYRTSYASLVNNATVRADNVTISLWPRANSWDFLSLPFDIKVSDIRLAYEDTPFVIRKYDGQKRADGLTGETWVDMTADSILHAGEGYIWRSASTNSSRNYTGFYLDALQTVNKNNIFANDDIEVALSYYESEFEHNRSWNFVGNPYPCFYDIRAMQTSAPITVWDKYNSSYEAFSPQDDAYILNPGQAFFVQRPVDEESIIFLKEGRQTNTTVRDIEYNNGSRARAQQAQRSVFNLNLSSSDGQGDRTRFVINPAATLQYESARDASKFQSIEQPAVQLYTIEDDVRYAINERPLSGGTVRLGMQLATDGLYTIMLDTKVENEVYLIDHLTGVEVRLDGNAEGYTFQSEAGTFESRFTIRLGQGGVTGIGELSILNSQLSTVYDLQGRPTNATQKGIYVKNGKKTVVK